MLTLKEISQSLKEADRMGGLVDEPEGSRYIQLSDTLVSRIVEALEEADAL